MLNYKKACKGLNFSFEIFSEVMSMNTQGDVLKAPAQSIYIWGSRNSINEIVVSEIYTNDFSVWHENSLYEFVWTSPKCSINFGDRMGVPNWIVSEHSCQGDH